MAGTRSSITRWRIRFVFDGDADLTNDLEQTPYPSPSRPRWERHARIGTAQHRGRIQSHFPCQVYLCSKCRRSGSPAPCVAARVRSGSARLAPDTRPRDLVGCTLAAVGLLVAHAAASRYRAPARACAVARAGVAPAHGSAPACSTTSSVFPFSAHAIAFSLVVCAVSIAASIGSARLHRLALLGFALGLLYLVRPQQLTVVLPLALMLAPIRRRPLREWIGWAGIGTVALMVLIAAQALAYSRTIGAWTLNAYAIDTGGFDWSHPQLSNVLLNPARGLLWVSPIVLLAAAGFALTPPRMVPRWFVVFAVQAILQLCVMACCWAPGQGDTFWRADVGECAAAVACGPGLLYVRTSGTRRILVAITAGACAVWTSRLLYLLHVRSSATPAMSHLASVRLALGL